MAGISSKASGKLENRFKFNDGTEFNTDLGLDWYETTFRGYDPQLGRFHQIDPLADANPSWSAYSFVQNNPLKFIDPLGLDTFNVNDIPAGREFNTTDVLIDDAGTMVGYWNGESWAQMFSELDDVVVVGAGGAASSANSPDNSQNISQGAIPWFIDPGMSGLEYHLGKSLDRYASDGVRGFNYGRPWLPGPRQRVYDRMVKQDPFLRTRPVNVNIPFSRSLQMPRNVVQGTAKVLKIGGYVTAAVTVASTEAAYNRGDISGTHRAMNHAMTVVGFFWPWGTLAAVTYSILEDSIYGKPED